MGYGQDTLHPGTYLKLLRYKTVEFSALASYSDSPPQIGTHLLYELSILGDAIATSTSLQVAANGDLTTTNYHNQRIGGSNGANSVPEAQTSDCCTIAAAQAVLGYYSPVFLFIPWFRRTDREKTIFLLFAAELAALNQIVGLVSHKRQGASVVGSKLDALTALRFSAATGNIGGILRRRNLA